MLNPLSRRSWLGRAAFASVIAATARETTFASSLPRTERARMKLSLAAYSFREHFKDAQKPDSNAAQSSTPMDMFKFIDYCAEHDCEAAELTSYYFPANTDKNLLLQVKRHAFLRGVAISGSAIGNTFTHPAGPEREKELAQARLWIDHCAVLGAPHVRIFAGAAPKGVSQEQAMANCIETTKVACAYAAERGVFLGIENHGGIVAEPGPLLDILKAVDSPWLGINLDSANFHTADPYADFAKCAPYAVNVQIKTEVRPKGAEKSSRSDLKRYIQILRDNHYQGYVALEFEEKADPYQTIPGVLKELNQLIHA